jgi:(p)ppGpp synthase/HD superfamily hydrolase
MYEAADSTPETELIEVPFCLADQLTTKLGSLGILSDRVKLAFDQAVESHSHKNRDSGRPYLNEHIFPVTDNTIEYLRQKAARERKAPSPVELEVVATVSLLHNTVEDDEGFDLTECENVFGSDISRLVYPLTRYGIDHSIYISKLTNAPKLAQIIKLFGRLNNLTCSVILAQAGDPATENRAKLKSYTEVTNDEFLPIADQLIDKEIYSRIHRLVDIAYTTIYDQENQT